MSSVLDRIKRQLAPSKKEKAEINYQAEPLKNIISKDSLREFFMSELAEPPAQTKEALFNGIIGFSDWYKPNTEKFSNPQRVVLSTLLQAREMIENGCGCKRAQRLKQANEYYKTFWLANSKTDLPKTLLQVGGFSSAGFMVDNDIFLKVTPESF